MPSLRLNTLLTARSFFSPGGGVCSPTTLVREAKRRGFTGLGLADECSTAGSVELARAGAAHGLSTPISATVPVKFAFGTHPVTLLAGSRVGFGHLNQLLTLALGRAERHVTLPELLEHAGDVFLLSGGRDGFPAHLLAHRRVSETLSTLETLRQAFPHRLFVQLFHGGFPGDGRRARQLWLLAREVGVPSVAAPQVVMSHHRQFPLLDALACARLGIDISTPHAGRPRNDAACLRTPISWGRVLPYPDALANADRLAAECAFPLVGQGFSVPAPHIPTGQSAQEYLRARCQAALPRLYRTPEGQAKAQAQLEHELEIVQGHGLAGFFLVAAEVTDFCRGEGILAAGRGSAAGSVLCHLLGITNEEPLKHDLLFERFLHTGLKSMPDVDIDIASHRRREVIAWVEERFKSTGSGEAMVANRITYRLPGAVQDLGRALGVPSEGRDRLTRALGRDFRHLPPHEARRASVVFEEVLGHAPVKTTLLELLELMEPDFVRHLAPHSGGVVLSAVPLTQFSPLVTSSGGIRMLMLNKDDAEDAGLIKLDLLGLRMLAALERAREEVVRLGGPYLDFGAIQDDDDPRVWSRISRGDTLGIFQVESPGQTRLSTQLKAKNRLQLAHQIALFRPGPIQSNTVHPYIRRARGQERVPEVFPVVARILAPTHGVILFQEQILRIIHQFAGMEWDAAERFRKALSKHPRAEQREELKRQFMLGAALKHGAFPFESEDVFEWCAAFQGFGFAESHAHAFAFHTYSSAWVREHWPAAFLAGVLGEAPGMWPAGTLVQEAGRWGVRMLPLDINHSHVRHRAETEKAVRVPLSAVQGISEDEARLIVLERHSHGPYTDVADLHARVPLKPGSLEALGQAGAFDSLCSRREALYRVGVLNNALKPGSAPLLSPTATPPDLPALTDFERLNWNHRTKHFSEDGLHPIGLLRGQLNDLGCVPLRKIGHRVQTRTAGLIVSRQRPPTARGFAFFVLEDGPHRAQMVISPDLWEENRQLLRDARALIVDGYAEREGYAVTLKAQRLADLEVPYRVRGYSYG